MRSNAGRLLEIPVLILFAAALSAVVGSMWKPWGCVAGPAFIVAIIGYFILNGLIEERRQRRAAWRLTDLADRRGTVPDWPELQGLVDVARLPQEVCLRAASHPDHPARAAFALGLQRTNPKDAESLRVLSGFIRDLPDSPASPDISTYLIDHAPLALSIDTARRALDSNHDLLARTAAIASVFRGGASWAEGHAEFAELVREKRSRVEPFMTHPITQGHFRKIVGTT